MLTVVNKTTSDITVREYCSNFKQEGMREFQGQCNIKVYSVYPMSINSSGKIETS